MTWEDVKWLLLIAFMLGVMIAGGCGWRAERLGGALTPPFFLPMLVIQVFSRNTRTEQGGQHGQTTNLPVGRGKTCQRQPAYSEGVVRPGPASRAEAPHDADGGDSRWPHALARHPSRPEGYACITV